MDFGLAEIPITLNDVQDHSPIWSLTRRDFSYSCTAVDKT